MNNYQIFLPLLGKGSFGVCFKAYNHARGIIGCLKVSDLALKQEEKEFFQKEFSLMSKLNHQNIIKAYDGFWDDDRFYIFMKLSHCNIETFCRSPRSYENIIYLAHQIAQGLNAIHSQKIVHRDLKPQNILIADENVVKIADFGIARALLMNRSTMMTPAGTFHYMAPELIQDELAGFSVDIFSFGVILYQLVSGSLPFNETTIEKQIQSICRGPIPLSPSIPPEFSQLIYKMLQRDLKKRPTLQEIISHSVIQLGPHLEVKFFTSDSKSRREKEFPPEIMYLLNKSASKEQALPSKSYNSSAKSTPSVESRETPRQSRIKKEHSSSCKSFESGKTGFDVCKGNSRHEAIRISGGLFCIACWVGGLNVINEFDDAFDWCVREGKVRGSDAYLNIGALTLGKQIAARYGRSPRIVDWNESGRGYDAINYDNHWYIIYNGKLFYNPTGPGIRIKPEHLDLCDHSPTSINAWMSNRIPLKGCHGKYVRAYPDGNLKCDSDWAQSWEHFQVEHHGDKISLKGDHGKYIRAYPDGNLKCDSDWAQQWEEFQVERHENKISLKGCHGKYIRAYPDGNLKCDSDWAQSWEEFHISISSCSIPNSGVVKFKNVVNVRNEPSASGSIPAQYSPGQTVRYDQVVQRDGRTWISYISSRGPRAYCCAIDCDGSQYVEYVGP